MTLRRVNSEMTAGIAPVVAVAVTPDGRVLASGLGNARIAVYDIDGNELGTLLDGERVANPAFIAWSIEVDMAGNIYVNDIRQQRLLKLNADGEIVAGQWLADIGHGDFHILGLAVADDGALILTETNSQYPSGIQPECSLVPRSITLTGSPASTRCHDSRSRSAALSMSGPVLVSRQHER